MDNLHYMTSILSVAKRGSDLSFMMFNWFTRVPYEQRAGLLRQFFVQYVYGYTTREKSGEGLPQEEIDYYEKNLRDKYFEEIDKMADRNLPEDVFYKQLCDFVFVCDGAEINAEMFWRFHACVQTRALPYCRVEIETTSVPSDEEYNECTSKLQDELQEIDTIVLMPEFSDFIERAQAVLERVEKGEDDLERAALLGDALLLMHYKSCHWGDYQKYIDGKKDLEVVLNGRLVSTFYRYEEGERPEIELDEDFLSAKERFKAYYQIDKEKLAKSACIMRFIETNRMGTYLQQAQLILRHIETESDFAKRLVLFIECLRYYEVLRDSIDEREKMEQITMKWYWWDLA